MLEKRQLVANFMSFKNSALENQGSFARVKFLI